MQHKLSVFAIVAVIFTTISSVYTVSFNNRKAKEREYEFHLLKEKQKVFEHFYNANFEAFNNVRKNKKGIPQSVVNEMMEFKKGLMNWGSDDIIKKFIEYDNKLIESQGKENNYYMLKEGNVFFKELRKELGFSDDKDLNIISIILTPETRKELKEKGII